MGDTMARIHINEDQICILRLAKDSRYTFVQSQHCHTIGRLISEKIYIYYLIYMICILISN